MSEQQEAKSAKHVPEDKKVVAGILALLFGALGIHKFYLGRTMQGVLFLLFSWTLIPGLIAFIEGIMILANGEQLV